MDVLEKARILGDSGRYDSCGPKMCEVNIREGLNSIYHAKAEHKTCRLFKTLMDNSCSFDCKYCGNAKSCNKKKAAYKPEELASVFMHLQKNLNVDGLFLSSGISKDPDTNTEKMLEAVRMLRYDHNFRGYVHFKVLPGTSYELVKQASELSNRMSINIEAPNSSALSEVSTCKDYKTDILRRQAWISKMNLSGGQTTQMIVSNNTTDKDVLRMTEWEYDNMKLRRMYFSSFTPIEGTPLQNEPATPMLRESHLYNVDFLVRSYNYKFKEFSSIMENGMLPREDPKLALAKANFSGALDINQASYDELIRVPGIGPKTAGKIVVQQGKIKKYEHLHNLGATISKAKPFIEVEGKRQAMLCEF